MLIKQERTIIMLIRREHYLLTNFKKPNFFTIKKHRITKQSPEIDLYRSAPKLK